MRLNRVSEQPVTGTGIGLALHGRWPNCIREKLTLENKPAINCFRLTLPSVHEHAIILRNKYTVVQPDEVAVMPETNEINISRLY